MRKYTVIIASTEDGFDSKQSLVQAWTEGRTDKLFHMAFMLPDFMAEEDVLTFGLGIAFQNGWSEGKTVYTIISHAKTEGFEMH